MVAEVKRNVLEDKFIFFFTSQSHNYTCFQVIRGRKVVKIFLLDVPNGLLNLSTFVNLIAYGFTALRTIKAVFTRRASQTNLSVQHHVRNQFVNLIA